MWVLFSFWYFSNDFSLMKSVKKIKWFFAQKKRKLLWSAPITLLERKEEIDLQIYTPHNNFSKRKDSDVNSRFCFVELLLFIASNLYIIFHTETLLRIRRAFINCEFMIQRIMEEIKICNIWKCWKCHSRNKKDKDEVEDKRHLFIVTLYWEVHVQSCI